MSLHRRMLVGLIGGALLGAAAHALVARPEGAPPAELAPVVDWLLTWVARPVGQIFLRLLFMLVLPIILAALALGVSGLGDARDLGRIGLKTLAYTVVVSALAVFIGLTLVNLLQPGGSMAPELRAKLVAGAANRDLGLATAAGFTSPIDMIIPANVAKAMADGSYLAVMFFGLMLGVGLALVRTEAARHFEQTLQGLYDVSMRLVQLVLHLAPFGVAALMFSFTVELGWEILQQLLYYVAVVVLGLAIHQFVVYSLSVKLLGGMSPLRFFRDVRDAMITAFSTASSNATLPTALRVADETLRLPQNVARFVLTIGSTANQNGTALFEGVTVLFLAQVYGVHLTLPSQALVVGICILAGIGTAGVPSGSLPVIAMILARVGVPIEGLGLIIGVDRFLDMCRTTINVTGDLAAAVVVSRSEERRLQRAARAAAR
jgi:DAACS family dicarboxylate/amino acid:cation (Na+ or H+) symporter